MPSRPSGADKEKERAQNEGGRGIGLAGRPPDRADLPARRHGLGTLVVTGKVAQQGEVLVNRTPEAPLLADRGG
jgi:hypothetical protein